MELIEYFALSGGSVKGLFSLGALLGLELTGMIDRIKGGVGTSIGGMIMAMIVMGYKMKDIATIAYELSLEDIIKNGNPLSILTKGYMSDWKEITSRVKKFITKVGFSRDVTLFELWEKTKKHLVLVTVCKFDKEGKDTGKIILLDHDTFPDLKLSKALKMTMALPWIFKPVEHLGKYYIDGGCRLNYPINVFPFEKTLGIRIGKRGHFGMKIPFQPPKQKTKINNTLGNPFVGGLFQNFVSIFELLFFLIDVMSEEIEKQILKGIRYNEICGIPGNFSLASFNIDNKDKMIMMKKGVNASIKYVNNPQPKTMEEWDQIYD